MNEINLNLEHLSKIIELSHKDNFEKIWLNSPVNAIPDIANICMNNLYDLLKELGLNPTEKYQESKSDLFFDYMELEEFFITIIESESSNNFEAINKYNEINKILEEKELDGKVSYDIMIDALRNLFAPYKKYEFNTDKFELIKNIAGTSISKVDEYASDDETVAIKKITVDNIKILKYIHREISFLTSLKHKHIADFCGYSLRGKIVDEEGSKIPSVWLITKFYPHNLCNLKSELKGTQKSIIAFQMAEVMYFLHENNVLNRDLKTGNFMLDEVQSTYVLKMIDFGYSKSDLHSLSDSGSAGTTNYMAPEISERKQYGKPVDVYSYGKTLWELFYNEIPPPYAEGESDELFQKEKKCTPYLQDLISKSIDKKPESRFTFKDILIYFLYPEFAEYLKSGKVKSDEFVFVEVKEKEKKEKEKSKEEEEEEEENEEEEEEEENAGEEISFPIMFEESDQEALNEFFRKERRKLKFKKNQ